MAADHKLSPKGSSDTLRTDLPMPFASTTSPTVGSSPGWGSPFASGGVSDGGFEFGAYDGGSSTKTSGTSNPSKWSAGHKLSKQNLAAFGAKLQSTAAHATSKYKSASKGGNSGGLVVNPYESKDEYITSSAPGQLLKSKMFRQSKTDLKSLSKIKPPSAIMSDRSPTITRSSKELDRIAGIGLHSPTGSHYNHHSFHEADKRHHHPHISFLKRDSPTAVLSSSASNSKLAAEGTMYSFHPVAAPPAALGGTPATSHMFKSAEECASFVASSWSLVTAKMEPVFAGVRKVKEPVEDTNIIVSVHFAAHVRGGGTASEMLERINDMLTAGLTSGPFVVRGELGSDLMKKLAHFWQEFYTTMLPEFEATFLPLQAEMEGYGQVLQDVAAADEYWKDLRVTRLEGRRTIAKQRPPSLRQIALIAFRNNVIMPIRPQLELALGDIGYDPSNATMPEVAASILQCISILALIQSNNAPQKAMDRLIEGLSSSWVSRPRMAKDRRGVVSRR